MGKKNERIEREVKLINAVHGVSRLWQKSDEKYSDQNSKGPIWSKLAKECGFEDGKEADTDNDGDDPEYVESEEEDDDEEDDEERGKRTQSRKSSGKSPRSSMSSFSASQAPSKAGSEDLFKRPSSVKGGKKRRTARDEVEQELLSIIRAPDDDDDEALCGRQVTNFLRRLPPMKRRPAIIEMQQLMFRFEYDAQLVYETATQQERL
ncbi:hypothetical protein AAVH_10302 [Aphelenchoides avenae]|nr:hypothetical protein AAVH_28200 [Aphelenchus avenae]KAH7722220.1 hypothetical protein AAVH_10302 [Aphelenchus avenae]